MDKMALSENGSVIFFAKEQERVMKMLVVKR
jgi:hypothetical protein